LTNAYDVAGSLAENSTANKAASDPRQIQKVEKLEEKLNKLKLVGFMDEIISNQHSLFFSFEGPTARVISNG
jgi:hypothetical protein